MSATRQSFRIMVISNNPDVLKSIEVTICFWNRGAAAMLFENSKLAWAELAHSSPDLLITALAMTGMRGEEIVRQLTGRKVDYPIIAICLTDKEEEWARDLASQGVKIKSLAMPWNVEDLCSLLDRSLGGQRKWPGPGDLNLAT